MSGFASFHNIGASIAALDAGIAFSSIAAGAGDNTNQVGVIIDRNAHNLPLSASLLVPFVATLTAAKTLSLGFTIEHGEDAALADTAVFATQAPAVVAALTGANHGVAKFDFDLAGAKRYLRVNIITDLNAVGADTAIVSALFVVGGEAVQPAN